MRERGGEEEINRERERERERDLTCFSCLPQLAEGKTLPPPEFLKGKILIKDKKIRRGAGNSTTSLGGMGMGTLTRGTHLPSVPEEMEATAPSMANASQTSEVNQYIVQLYCIFSYMYSMPVTGSCFCVCVCVCVCKLIIQDLC